MALCCVWLAEWFAERGPASYLEENGCFMEWVCFLSFVPSSHLGFKGICIPPQKLTSGDSTHIYTLSLALIYSMWDFGFFNTLLLATWLVWVWCMLVWTVKHAVQKWETVYWMCAVEVAIWLFSCLTKLPPTARFLPFLFHVLLKENM